MSVRMQPAVLDIEPAWDIAKLFPAQGFWADEDYFLLDACFAEGEQE